MQQKFSPKDFFLWLGAMVALYVSVFSLLSLLFEWIGIVFPDVQQGYVDPYNSGIRFAIAAVIVFFPLYIWLTRMLNNDVRKHHEKRELGIRKWLIMLTLFVAGVTMAGDLVTLINYFLGGEITTRFILKVIVVVVVAGTVFAYYLYDLLDRWEKNPKQATQVGWVASLLVLASLVGGFIVVGSPMSQRDIRFDQTRVNDLQTIQYNITSYWQAKQQLPPTLDALNNSLQGFTVPVDPKTAAPYEYTKTASTTFTLCATFAKPTPANETRPMMAVAGIKNGDAWFHKIGRTCFERALDPDFFPPINAAGGNGNNGKIIPPVPTIGGVR